MLGCQLFRAVFNALVMETTKEVIDSSFRDNHVVYEKRIMLVCQDPT